MKQIFIFLILFSAFFRIAEGNSDWVTSPEENMRIASLIVEATVLDIWYDESSKGVPFAVIQLRVDHHIAGNSPDVIEIRRAFVTPSLQFLDTNVLPEYTIGERFILCLRPKENGYNTVGLYNGKFVIKNNFIHHTKIPVDQFKQQILQIRNGSNEKFPEELPRYGSESGKAKRIKQNQENFMLLCGGGEPFLDDEFWAWDFTWNTNYIPAEMHYNPDDDPGNAPGSGTIATLAELAYELWEDDYSFFSFNNASPFTTSAGYYGDNTSVILWDNLFDDTLLARAYPFPNTPSKIENCNTDGPGSNRSVDVIFNTEWMGGWHFGSTPPGSFTAGSVDFVEVLAHELGHGMGMAHNSDNENSIMHNDYGDREGDVRGQTDGDLAGNIYQHTVSDISGLSNSFPHDVALSASTNNFTADDDFTVPENDHIEITSGKTLTFTNPGILTIEGETVIGDDFTMEDGSIDVENTGSLEFLGSALLEFIEIPVSPPLYMIPRLSVRGHFTSTNSDIITMRLSPNATFSDWQGITVYSTADGSDLRGIDIEDAKTGIHLSSVSNVILQNIEVDSPVDAGISSASSSFEADDIDINGSSEYGMELVGGTPEVDEYDVTNSTASGVYIRQMATSSTAEGSISGSGGGGSNAGIWVDDASHSHLNGTIGSNSGWDVSAVNDASVLFNGTSWDGSQPFSHVDGSSSLTVQNPNNPQKAVSPVASARTKLLRDWSEKVRENASEAVLWLENKQRTYSSELKGVAAMLLADYYLAHSNFSQAERALRETSQESRGYLKPGSVAHREILLALHGSADESLAIESLNGLRQAGWSEVWLQRYERMVEEKYGVKPEAELADQKIEEDSSTPQTAELGNYPNPFNPATTISFAVPSEGDVRLDVYNTLGRRVATLVNERLQAGTYETLWDASHIASGSYIYRLQVNGQILTRTMAVIK